MLRAVLQIVPNIWSTMQRLFFTGTSRERRTEEMNGSALYHFVSEGAMKADINAHRYIEFGKHKQHLYGIKMDSVIEVIESGRMCVLDVNPQVCCL